MLEAPPGRDLHQRHTRFNEAAGVDPADASVGGGVLPQAIRAASMRPRG